MDLPILALAAIGLTAFGFADLAKPAPPPKAEGPAALVGQPLYGSEDPIPRWGDPLRAEDLPLEDLGRVAGVLTTPEGEARGIVVAVGGLWGYGAQEVELEVERLHLIRAGDGQDRLVVDLSNSGAEPDRG